jgi:hypothetical protein
MLDLRLAVIDEERNGVKKPVLAFVDGAGETVTVVSRDFKSGRLVRDWLAEAHRCMDLAAPPEVVAPPIETGASASAPIEPFVASPAV